MEHDVGCVYLVGAGCGAADMITVRGLRLLQRCQTVVYDDLIDQELLDSVPVEAEKIYMGKRCGKHAAPQEEISQTLVNKARQGKIVVRLKGGDPFVFGRGGEEIQALQAAGVPYEEVPGISSSIAIPAVAGIPVTHRNVSRSFHVVTGHASNTPDGLPENFEYLAALRGTLVFLMGFGQLEAIAEHLIRAGKAPDTPAAVVSGGNVLSPATVRGTLADIARRTRESNVSAPAVIVVGEAAALNFSATLKLPLDGVCVGITGTEAVSAKLRTGLEDLGAKVYQVERSIVEALPLTLDLEELCSGSHWLVFTSGNGISIFFSHLRKQKIDLRRLRNCKFAVIGAYTGEELERRGLFPDLCPEVFTGAALAEALCRQVRDGEDVFLLRSREGSQVLNRRLKEANIPFRDVPLYTLYADPVTAERSRAVMKKLDYLAFSSASGVQMFLETQGEIPDNAVCVCIGGSTAWALAERYKKPFLTADAISAGGIIQAILDHQVQEDAWAGRRERSHTEQPPAGVGIDTSPEAWPVLVQAALNGRSAGRHTGSGRRGM